MTINFSAPKQYAKKPSRERPRDDRDDDEDSDYGRGRSDDDRDRDRGRDRDRDRSHDDRDRGRDRSYDDRDRDRSYDDRDRDRSYDDRGRGGNDRRERDSRRNSRENSRERDQRDSRDYDRDRDRDRGSGRGRDHSRGYDSYDEQDNYRGRDRRDYDDDRDDRPYDDRDDDNYDDDQDDGGEYDDYDSREEYYRDDGRDHREHDRQAFHDHRSSQEDSAGIVRRSHTDIPLADPKEALRRGLGQANDSAKPSDAQGAKGTDPTASSVVTKPSNGADSSHPARTVLTGRLTIFNFQPILRSTYRELRAFVTSPCQPGVVTRCYIERNRSGSKMLAPFFSLCADLEDGTGRELMVCRKVLRSRSSHYVFSLKAEDLWRKREQRSRLYLGKLRAINANDYVLYDNGICAAPEESDAVLDARENGTDTSSWAAPTDETALAKKVERDRKADSAGAKDEVSLYRRELVSIHFNTKTRPPPKGKLGMEVCVPSPSPGGAAPGAAASASSAGGKNGGIFNIQRPFEKIRHAGKQNVMYSKSCLIFHEKATRYDPLSSCLVDFRGRAHMASVKNFQLVSSEPMNAVLNENAMHEQLLKQDADKEYILQMGKVRK